MTNRFDTPSPGRPRGETFADEWAAEWVARAFNRSTSTARRARFNRDKTSPCALQLAAERRYDAETERLRRFLRGQRRADIEMDRRIA